MDVFLPCDRGGLWKFSSVASINKILIVISSYLFLKINGFKKFRRFLK